MKFPFTGSIRYIGSLIVALALLPALGLILYAGKIDSRQARAEAEADAARQVRAVAQQQKLVFESTRTLLLTLSQLEEVQHPDLDALRTLLKSLRLRYPTYADLRFCDLEGRTLVSTSPTPTQLSERELAALMEIKDIPAFSILPFTRSHEDDTPALNCVFPVMEKDSISGFLVASITISLPGSEAAAFRNKRGYLLQIADTTGQVCFSSHDTEAPATLTEHEMQNIFKEGEDSGFFTSTLNGKEALVAFERLRLNIFGPSYINILLSVEKDHIYLPVQKLLKRNIILFALVTLFAFAASWNFARITLVAPIRKLLEVATQIKGGDLTARISLPKAASEFEVLASSFNSMAAVLETKGRDLINAGNMAMAASKAKSEFLANMSHEIRTPMNAILGMTYLAQRTPLNDRQANYINKIHSEATRLLAVINDILDFSKIEAGKLHLEHVPFDLKEKLFSLQPPFESAAGRKNLSFRIELDETLPPVVLGDSFHLGQVLTTLVNHAIKHTDSGMVGLKCSPGPAEGNTILLSFNIFDTGTGFTPEQLESVFPSDSPDQSPLGGSELSLVVARRLVELMGGKMSIESSVGRGTTASFNIPFQKVASFQVRTDGETRELTTFRTLVADPLKQTRIDLVRELNSFSMQVETASTQEEVLKLLEESTSKNPFYLLLLDMSLLPYKDGTLPEHIRQNLLLDVTPAIIAITRADRQGVLQDAEKSGADMILSRPFDSSVLFNTLQEALVQKHFLGMGEEERHEDNSGAPLAGAHLLLVEDNIINQQIAEEILASAGAVVDIAENGSIAVDMLKKHLPHIPYQAVLMDLQMPVMDGFEATKYIRTTMGLEALPIIAMTAHTINNDWEQCAEVGINDYIAKPIEVSKLFATLKKWVGPALRPDPAAVKP